LRGHYYLLTALVLIFIAVAFSGLLNHISRVVLGSRPQGIPWRQKEPLSGKIALVFLGVCMLGLGLVIPQPFVDLLANCQKLVLGH